MTPFDVFGFTDVRSGWVSVRATVCDASSFCLSGHRCFCQADDSDDDDTSEKKSFIDTASYGHDTKYTR